MRILVNDIAASEGGAMTVLQEFYRYIKENEMEHEWIFLLSQPCLEETARIKVITLPQIKSSRFKKLAFDFFTGRRFILSLHPDAVLSLQNIITFGLKVPQTVYIHQSIPFQDVKQFSFFKSTERTAAIYQHLIGRVIKLSAKKASKVVVQTEWMKKAVCSKANLPAEKVITILPDILGALNSSASFDNTAFFYPTADIIYKNNECIYKACELLSQSCSSDYHVKLTIERGVNDSHVEYIGRIPREQVLAAYAKSTLIFPSYIETFGYPLAEARQAGTVILASDCAFSHEVLQGYENAYYFNPFRPRELSDLMEKVITGQIAKKAVCEQRQVRENSWAQLVREVIKA